MPEIEEGAEPSQIAKTDKKKTPMYTKAQINLGQLLVTTRGDVISLHKDGYYAEINPKRLVPLLIFLTNVETLRIAENRMETARFDFLGGSFYYSQDDDTVYVTVQKAEEPFHGAAFSMFKTAILTAFEMINYQKTVGNE